MEARHLLATLVLVLGIAIGSSRVSASAPAQSPPPKAPAQIKSTQKIEVSIVVVDAPEINWSDISQSASGVARFGTYRLPVKLRSLKDDHQATPPVLIVEFQ
jgi:hypothetical protein